MDQWLRNGARAFGLAAVALATLAGCSGDRSPSHQGAAAGGEFRINMRGEPDTIDPGRSNFSTSILVASQAFEALLGYDKDLVLQPAAAVEVPSVTNGGISSDGRTYTFRLRPEARWSDGRPVMARDFAFAIRRNLDPAVAAPYATTLYDITGARAFHTALGSKDAPRNPSAGELTALRDAVAVEARGDHTLVVRIDAPRPTFLHIMALWVAWPLREDILAAHGDRWTEPPSYVGNGPFMLTRWAHQERLEFVPNPHYHGQKPGLTKLTLLQINDANQAFLAYQNNEVDAVAVPDANVQLVLNDPALRAQAVRFNQTAVFGFQFNVQRPPLNDVRVRRALAMAVDREALINKVAQGIGKPAYSLIPPGMPGHDPDVGTEFRFNPEKARSLLATAGYPDPSKLPPLAYVFFDNTGNRLRAEFFQAQMKQHLNLAVTLEPLDARSFQQRFNNSQFTVAFSGWGADYPDPDNFVPELFRSDSGNNHTGYARPEVDRLADQCRKEPDAGARARACAEAQRKLVSDQPWAFAFYRENLWLVKPHVKGFQVTAKDHLPGSRFYHQITIAG